MALNEADTRAKLIDPALHRRAWTEDLIRREETAGAIEIVDGRARRRGKGRCDYTLRVKVSAGPHPVAVALIEAKAESLPPSHGLEQGKLYASAQRLNVPFVFATNGHLYIEYDRYTGLTTDPRSLALFPTPEELLLRYERHMGFSLDAESARPLVTPYRGGESSRRYYQDAAIRATFEKIARCAARGEAPRALLALATGSGKTFLAVNLLKRVGDAGQLRRALFVCDRDELRGQANTAFQNMFGADAAAVFQNPDGTNNARNARVHIATYQTLDVAGEEGTANFLLRHYPENYFSHIVIDECHRSAWGKWSQVFTRNPDAVQIGLTATPRRLEFPEKSKEMAEDARITADNIRHFGKPVYVYDMAQGIEDGYLAACEIYRFDLFHDNKAINERTAGIAREELRGRRLTNADTGQPIVPEAARDHYDAPDLDARLLMPERVAAMTSSLFEHLLATGGPEQKTIVFCARDRHADAVASAMNNLYARWCAANGRALADNYAFKCTAASGGGDYLPDFRGASRHHFIATTVDLLTTGVDVPVVRNVVFFKYVRSPIAFYQMVGRGTRLDPASGKLMFRIYDYTDATRLFGQQFLTKYEPPRAPSDGGGTGGDDEPTIQVEGFDVKVTPAGRLILTMVDGQAMPVTVEEYKERLAAKLVEEAPTLDCFRTIWIEPDARRDLVDKLPEKGRSAFVLRTLVGMEDCDLYDVLADVGYGLAPRTRRERADAFSYKHEQWLSGIPVKAAATVRAIASQFARGGTEGIENPQVFDTPEVRSAGGIRALRELGRPADVLRETKERMFAA